MADFPEALNHGSIWEVFPDVFTVTGGFPFGRGLSITRNMTIVRQGGELTLINSVRLKPEGEAALEKLGKVTHLLRIGAFHGRDDAYYKDRFEPKLWAPPGTRHEGGLSTDHELRPGAGSPLEGSTVFSFDRAKRPEVALLLEREGGVLIPCDSFQNWTTFEGCSLLGRIMMPLMGFGPTHIGSPWVKGQGGTALRADFDRLAELPFQHLIPAHGTPLKGAAKPGLHKAIAGRFG